MRRVGLPVQALLSRVAGIVDTGMTWDRRCPVCGGRDVQPQDAVIRYCSECRFQWSVELSYALLASLARAHNVGPVTQIRAGRRLERAVQVSPDVPIIQVRGPTGGPGQEDSNEGNG